LYKRENGEKRRDEWEGGGRTKKRGPTFPLLPHSSHSPFSPRFRATKEHSHAALPDKTAKENRSERAPYDILITHFKTWNNNIKNYKKFVYVRLNDDMNNTHMALFI
jgi:hypothetical protein